MLFSFLALLHPVVKVGMWPWSGTALVCLRVAFLRQLCVAGSAVDDGPVVRVMAPSSLLELETGAQME